MGPREGRDLFAYSLLWGLLFLISFSCASSFLLSDNLTGCCRCLPSSLPASSFTPKFSSPSLESSAGGPSGVACLCFAITDFHIASGGCILCTILVNLSLHLGLLSDLPLTACLSVKM